MTKTEDYELEKVTLNLFQGEFHALKLLYPRLGAGKVIRELVHKHLAERGVKPPSPIDLADLEIHQ